MNGNTTEYDDLSIISGIASVRQRWLRESLGVFTFRGLSVLSATRAAEQLKADGHNIPLGDLKKWIDLARSKLEEPHTAEEEWQPFAAFIVEYQARNVVDESAENRTTVHYIQGGKDEKWSGLEGKELCRWMLGHLGEQVPDDFTAEVTATEPEVHISDKAETSPEAPSIEEPETTLPSGTRISSPLETEEPEPVKTAEEKEATVKRSPPGRSPFKIKVEQLRVRQAPSTTLAFNAGQKNRPLLGDIMGRKSFALEALFALVEMPTGNGLDKYGYHAEFYARERSSGEKIFLGDSELQNLSSDESNYVTGLPEVVLPSGAYRLQVLVTVETTPAARSHLTAPLLYVS